MKVVRAIVDNVKDHARRTFRGDTCITTPSDDLPEAVRGLRKAAKGDEGKSSGRERGR